MYLLGDRATFGIAALGLLALLEARLADTWRTNAPRLRPLLFPATLLFSLTGAHALAGQLEPQRAIGILTIGIPALTVGAVSTGDNRVASTASALLLPLSLATLAGPASPFPPLNPIFASSLLLSALILAANGFPRRWNTASLLVTGGAFAGTLRNLGPAIAGTVAALLYFRSGAKSISPGQKKRTRTIQLLILLLFPIAAITIGTALFEEVFRADLLSASEQDTQTRLATWRQVLQNLTVFGAGTPEIVISSDETIPHAHNYVVGAAHSLGLVGLGAILYLTARAIKGASRDSASPITPLASATLVLTLFSADAMLYAPFWYSIGYLSGRASSAPTER
jgi:hypothetical protein